jgi:hypothetical protein
MHYGNVMHYESAIDGKMVLVSESLTMTMISKMKMMSLPTMFLRRRIGAQRVQRVQADDHAQRSPKSHDAKEDALRLRQNAGTEMTVPTNIRRTMASKLGSIHHPPSEHTAEEMKKKDDDMSTQVTMKNEENRI